MAPPPDAFKNVCIRDKIHQDLPEKPNYVTPITYEAHNPLDVEFRSPGAYKERWSTTIGKFKVPINFSRTNPLPVKTEPQSEENSISKIMSQKSIDSKLENHMAGSKMSHASILAT